MTGSEQDLICISGAPLVPRTAWWHRLGLWKYVGDTAAMRDATDMDFQYLLVVWIVACEIPGMPWTSSAPAKKLLVLRDKANKWALKEGGYASGAGRQLDRRLLNPGRWWVAVISSE